ncbi:phosphate ABC transporter substrate-binding protein [Desulfovulcanus sp.]
MKKNLFYFVLAIFLGLSLSAHNVLAESKYLAAFAGLKGKIDIAGGTAHIPVMKEAAKRIMIYNPNIRITVAGGGSGVGVQKVGEGLVDIGNTGRPVSPEERAKYGLKSYAFAIDGVAVAVHPSNSVQALSVKQIQDIYAGKVKNWSAVGGENSPIHLYTRDEASGTRAVFWKKLLKKGSIADNANIVPSNGAMKVAVSRDENAIGYLSIGHIDNTIVPVKIDGVYPSQENAKNGSYKVVRKLYMNTKGEPGKLVKVFINYILSPEGAEIIKKCGFIPLSN